MIDILLVGGEKDGHRVQAEPGCRPLRFAKGRPFDYKEFLKEVPEFPPILIEEYWVERVSYGDRGWWIGVHSSLTLPEAMEQIIGRY